MEEVERASEVDVPEDLEPEAENFSESADEAAVGEERKTEPGSPAEELAQVAEQAADGVREDLDLPEPEDEREWYVIHCYSSHENKVKQNLEQRIESLDLRDKIFQVVVPTEDELEVRYGERQTVERRIFPGYVLVQMILDDDSWYAVRDTPGVIGFVGMGQEPAPLQPEEVQAIMKRMEAEAPKIKVTFKPGQKVRIIDGPFEEFIGVVEEIDMDRAKVKVMVSFFGRETPVELDFLQVEKI